MFMEKLLNALKEKFKEYMELMTATGHDDTEEEFRKTYIVENIFNMTTYDTRLSVMFSDTIVEVMRVIYERRNFEYIKDKNNYVKFILVANMLDWMHMIEWGTSIRGCWFDNNYGKPMKFSELDDEEFIIDNPDDYIKLIEWFECKDLKGEKE